MQIKKGLLIGLFFVLSTPVLFGQNIGHSSISWIDSNRNNRNITTEVYYPSNLNGNNVPVANGRFSFIVFGHGFSMVWSAYQNIWSALVPEGYIVVIPTTEGSLSPSHSNFGLDLEFLIKKIKLTGVGNIIPPSQIGPNSALMGHSMGGGAAFLASANSTGATTLVTFAAANTNPSSITAAQQVTLPTLVISGSNDCVAPPNQHQDPMYQSTISPLKTQLYIQGGGHCYFADYNFNCAFGEATCTPAPTISRSQQQSATTDFVKLWLSYFLNNNCSDAQRFQDSLIQSQRISFRQSRSIACPNSIQISADETTDLQLLPNPNSGKFTIENLKNVELITVFNSLGIQMFSISKPEKSCSIQLPNPIPGIYFLHFQLNNGQFILKKMIIH